MKSAIALSGGGHRASLFALGVLLYLAEAGKSREVTSMASVSGGSLANGVVAQSLDYREAPPAEVEKVVARTARQITHKGTLFAAWVTWAYLVPVVAFGLAVMIIPWLLPLAGAIKAGIFALGLFVLVVAATFRSWVSAQAFGQALFSPSGSPTKLAEISTSTDHVICATDLHAGEHVYFSGRFVCSYRFGLGVPADLPLHSAVQASAAFPGAFSPAWLRRDRHQFQDPGQPEAGRTRLMALVDGGVYDNMGDQWAHGLDNRRRRFASLGPSFQEADELVVVSASAGLAWRSMGRLRLPLLGEVLTLGRDISVLYDNGNSVRRRELIARFDLAAREDNGLQGTLIHITQSPFDVAKAYEPAGAEWPERAGRARAALSLLSHEGEDTEDRWEKVAEANARVKTTLFRIKAEISARLLRHAYVLAMINTHVILGYPLPDLPDEDRFRAMVRELG